MEDQAYLDEDVVKDIVVLVVGQTGAGKSTQIDSMLNYLLGIKWTESVRFKVVNELQTVTAESLHAGRAPFSKLSLDADVLIFSCEPVQLFA